MLFVHVHTINGIQSFRNTHRSSGIYLGYLILKNRGVGMSSDYRCLEQLDSNSKLSQGDVIAWTESQDFQSKVAVVVTADCDLDKGKHWGRITVVPLIPVKTYIEEVYLPKQLTLQDQFLFSIFSKEIHKLLNVEPPPTVDALEQLLSLQTLPAPINTSDRATKAHALLRQARDLNKTMTSVEALDNALILINPSTKSLSAQRIETFLQNPPGDCMLLPKFLELNDLSPGIHIAFLRALREVSEQKIATKTSEVMPGCAQRVGRLVPVLRYRLTQMLTQVFSDIGLPDEFETTIKNERTDFVQSLTKKTKEPA